MNNKLDLTKLSLKQTIIYAVALLIGIVLMIIANIINMPNVIRGILSCISMIALTISITLFIVGGLGTYKHIRSTGTEKQIKRADTIMYIICYGGGILCAIFAVATLMIK